MAQAAGVSLSTASRALAGKPTVSGRTRARVLQAARELHYCANDAVRSLSTSAEDRRLLAFITFGLIEPHAQLTAGMSAVVRAHKSTFMLYICETDEEEARAMASLVRQRPRGIILGRSGADVGRHEAFARRMKHYTDLLDPMGAKLVFCVMPPLDEVPSIPSVNYDQTNVVQQAVLALAERGHRNMAFLGAGNYSTATQREDGFRAGMRNIGCEGQVIVCENITEDAHAAALRLLRQPRSDRPTAIVAFSDFMAIGVYRAAHDLGLRIPEDLSVIGFDDLMCDVDLTPSLSSIHAPWQSMGEQAARFVFDGVPAGTSPHVTFSSRLVLRDSVGPVPA